MDLVSDGYTFGPNCVHRVDGVRGNPGAAVRQELCRGFFTVGRIPDQGNPDIDYSGLVINHYNTLVKSF